MMRSRVTRGWTAAKPQGKAESYQIEVLEINDNEMTVQVSYGLGGQGDPPRFDKGEPFPMDGQKFFIEKVFHSEATTDGVIVRTLLLRKRTF